MRAAGCAQDNAVAGTMETAPEPRRCRPWVVARATQVKATLSRGNADGRPARDSEPRARPFENGGLRLALAPDPSLKVKKKREEKSKRVEFSRACARDALTRTRARADASNESRERAGGIKGCAHPEWVKLLRQQSKACNAKSKNGGAPGRFKPPWTCPRPRAATRPLPPFKRP
jgi:hypothetical protein